MKRVFDEELEDRNAKLTREWLMMPAGKPLFNAIENAMKHHHDSVIGVLTDNPMKDVLTTQREVGAEIALTQLIEAIAYELSPEANI